MLMVVGLLVVFTTLIVLAMVIGLALGREARRPRRRRRRGSGARSLAKPGKRQRSIGGIWS
jgi:Na+-transporting methylmalonyl-CoA/oxaloacetate decarboxylase gamma subunit